MKKLLIIIILLLILPAVLAFSIKDFLINFKEIFIGISGADTTMFNPSICNENELRCGNGNECGGSPCVIKCQNNNWIEWEYCAYQCSNGECINQQIEQEQINLNGGEPTTQQCNDGTIYNQCSNNKPYYCSNGNLIQNCNTCGCQTGKECINNICVENEPYDPGGRENNQDPNLLNLPPKILSIPDKTLKTGETIRFKITAIDPDKDPLYYYFTNQENKITTERLECSIIENTINCKAIRDGEENIKIIVSDGKDEVKTNFKINIIKKLYKAEPGVAAGLINTPPVADAGSDITGNPGIPILLDASLSYDKEGLTDTYKWYENNNLIATGKTVEKIFELGKHQIILEVIDTEGATDTDTITITIEQRKACKNTQTKYYPEDTICNSAWPTNEGETFKINSLTEGACGLFDVCSEELDPIIEDSIKCCTEGSIDSKKIAACNFANENSDTFKKCQAIYLIESLGGSAIYMKGYFDSEMCCKGVGILCPSENYLYTPNPLPEWLKNKGLQCLNTPENNPNGVWRSNTKWELNNIALFDASATTSLKELKTGTCVDYSVATTTLLRKIGITSKDILTVEASDHAYNLIRFPLDKKYTIFDGTGNNRGLKLGKVPPGYEYCEKIINCYNDLGKVTCPSNKNIYGCENIKENIGRTAGRQVVGVKGTLQSFWDKIWREITR